MPRLRFTLAAAAALLHACAADPPAEIRAVVPAEQRLRQGIAAAQAGELDLALAELDAALRLAPAGGADLGLEAQRWLAHVRMLRCEPEDALAAFERGIALDPADPWLRYGQGTALQELGRYAEAVDAFSRALELDPAHLKALQWRGATHALLGAHRAAVADFTRVLELLPQADEEALARWGGDRAELRRWTLRARGRALDALGEPQAAERDRAASEESPAPGGPRGPSPSLGGRPEA